MISLPKWLITRPRKLPNASDPLEAPAERTTSSHSVGTNINNPVVDIYRPHIQSGNCLIATGYQDFLSSLSILLTEVPELRDPEPTEQIRIRIAFGIDTGNTSRIGRSIPVSQEMRLYWLERSGLQVEDHADLMAVLARNAIATGMIQLRVFDPALAKELYGIAGDRRMHAKIVSRDIDRKRYRACAGIQERKDRVVLLAERTDTLEIFAEELSSMGRHTNFVVGNRQKGEASALTSLYGKDAGSFERIANGRSVESYFRPGGRKAPKGPASVFMTYKMAEGINLQSGDTLVLLGLTSNLKELIQGLGRIDRIDSEFEEVNYHLVDFPVGRFASDEKIAQRIANYRALSGEELTDVLDRLEAEDTEAILESVISYLRAPRVLRANNYHDLLSRLSKQITPARVADVSKAKIDGTWGAELALVSGREAFSMLHLKGTDGRDNFLPPRLLMIRQSGSEGAEIIRDQIACAQQLEDAYERTRSLGLEDDSPSQKLITAALAALASHVDELTEWDLRPSRLESLLKALCR